MLYSFLRQAARQWTKSEAVARGGQVATFGWLAARSSALAEELSALAGRKVGLAVTQGPDWLASAAALDALGCRAFLIGQAPDSPRVIELAERYGLAGALHDRRQELPRPPFVRISEPSGSPVESSAEPRGGSSVVLFTSGTSGEPKAAIHTWDSLASGVRRLGTGKLVGTRMLLAYDLTHYAGLQVLLTALLNGARLSVPESGQVADLVELIIHDRVTFVSGTPTFWRMLLGSATVPQRRQMDLRQITLGGEVVNQPILDALARTFPRARITHIYASTEMGVCFSVHDGREGFPVEFLDSEALPVRLKVRDGRLWVRSNRAMAGYVGGAEAGRVRDRWFDTGDAVEVRGDRVCFRGRDSSRINVGGLKVYPEEIEAVIRQVAGVAEVRVSGVESSITGQLVQAEVVPAPGSDPARLRQQVNAFCRERLQPHKQPRVIKLVDNLGLADTMKVPRRNVDGHE